MTSLPSTISRSKAALGNHLRQNPGGEQDGQQNRNCRKVRLRTDGKPFFSICIPLQVNRLSPLYTISLRFSSLRARAGGTRCGNRRLRANPGRRPGFPGRAHALPGRPDLRARAETSRRGGRPRRRKKAARRTPPPRACPHGAPSPSGAQNRCPFARRRKIL